MVGETGFASLDRVRDEALLAPLWPEGSGVALLDQTRLPFERMVFVASTAAELGAAVAAMQVRGAGAIGCAGALGAYLAVRQAPQEPDDWVAMVAPLTAARPPAVALRLAVDEVLALARQSPEPVEGAAQAALGEGVRREESGI